MNFDWKTYVQNYEDLRKAGINNEIKALNHWKHHGEKEGRTFQTITNTVMSKNNNFDNIVDCTFKNYEFKIKKKILIIISCHTNWSSAHI